jgi:hypothetical protein
MEDKSMYENREEQIVFFEQLNLGWVLNMDFLNAMGTSNLYWETEFDIFTGKKRAEAKWYF